MPLAAQPNRGYADYQRLENWDSGVLYDLEPGSIVGGRTSPVIDVSRYAYLGGIVDPLVTDQHLNIHWYADSGATISVAVRDLVFTPSIADGAQLRLPNLGPFVQLTISAIGGGAYTPVIRLFGTNRYHPCEFIPSNPVIVDQSGAALGASSNVAFFPTDYYAGPMSVSLFAGQASHVALAYQATSGAFNVSMESDIVANTRVIRTMIAPPGSWLVNIVNDTAVATTVFCRVTPSLTGSS